MLNFYSYSDSGSLSSIMSNGMGIKLREGARVHRDEKVSYCQTNGVENNRYPKIGIPLSGMLHWSQKHLSGEELIWGWVHIVTNMRKV